MVILYQTQSGKEYPGLWPDKADEHCTKAKGRELHEIYTHKGSCLMGFAI